MKIKNLLNLGLILGCGLSAQAQTSVFHEGFDAAQTKQSSDVAWYEFINQEEGDSWSISGDAYKGEGSLNFFNDGTAYDASSWWRRAVKFRNLPLQEGKSYRLVHYLKGSNTYTGEDGTSQKCHVTVSLMQGGENADIPLLDANGNEFRYDYQYLNPDSYEKYTRMFYFASAALQKDTYAKNNPDKDPLADTFFATINVYNPGDFYLDEVDLVESSIAGVYYSQNVIKVDFGYGTNIATLAKANTLGCVILPNEVASVKIGGKDVAVEAVELHQDGFMYIFLEEGLDEDNKTADIEVAFKNSTDSQYQVLYSGDLAPQGAAFDFSGEKAEFEDGLQDVSSWAYTEPLVASTVPEDESFNLDESTNSISVTFDKPVLTTDVDGHDLVAKLNDSEALVLTTTAPSAEEGVYTLTFQRKDGKAFTKGSYNVSIEGICSDKYTPMSNAVQFSFETGKETLAKETVTPIETVNFDANAAGTIPTDWVVNIDGADEPLAAGTSPGYGPRIFSFADGGDVKNGFYFRATTADKTSTAVYGTTEGKELILPAGKIRVIVNAFLWKSSTEPLVCELLDANGNVVASKSQSLENSVSGSTSAVVTADKIQLTDYENPAEGKFTLRISLASTGSYNETVLGGFVVNTVVGEPGVKDDVLFADKTYGGKNGVNAEDNCAPKAGSGWVLYQGGAAREAGANFNYNGTRLFSLGIKNLTWGYYTNGSWPNNYIIYGEGGEGEPTLTLPAGKVQFTYYAANWKTSERNLYSQLIDADGNLVVDRTDVITMTPNMDGNRNASVETNKIQYSVNIPAAGDYKLKLGGDGEMFVGNYSIEKMPSISLHFAQLLDDAVTAAQEEADKCADEQYDGTTKTALLADITKYSADQNMHTAKEYNAAIAEINALTKAMATRRTTLSDYATALTNIQNLMTTVADSKYQTLEAYSKLDAKYNQYKDVAGSSLEDAELTSATTDLQNGYTLMNNLYTKGIALLTNQLTNAAGKIVALDSDADTEEMVLAAGNAITDDQALAKMLKLRLTQAIYEKIANANPFEVLDTTTMQTEADSIDVSSYIQNANCYITDVTADRTLNNMSDLPGWNVNVIRGNVGTQWGWVSETVSENNPINDVTLIAGWNSEFDMSQNLEYLPVGKYRYVSGTQDRGFEDTSADKTARMAESGHWTVTGTNGTNEETGDILSYIYWQVGEQKDSVAFDVTDQGQWYGLTNCKSNIIDVPATTGKYYGEMTIGSHPIEYQATGSVDNFQLYLVNKTEGFDYAAAAKAVNQKIIDGIENVQAPEGEPSSVKYYTIDGKQTNSPKGVAIKVASWKNGFMKVSKVIVK